MKRLSEISFAMKHVYVMMVAFVLSVQMLDLFAHSKMAQTQPTDGAVLEASPEEILLTFSKPSRLVTVVIKSKSLDDDMRIEFKNDTSFVEKKIVPLMESFAAGEYEVLWRALAKDGHVIKGNFSFTIK